MSFNIPNLQTLIDRGAADVEAHLPGADARLRRSNLNVLMRVMAGHIYGLYGFLKWMWQQVMIDTAESDILERHATTWGISRHPAVPATGKIVVTGTDGAIVPAGATFVCTSGARYTVDDAVFTADGMTLVSVTAEVAGRDGNAAAGTQIATDMPIAGVQARAQVAPGGLTGGTDIEAVEDFRARLLARIRQPPQGGAEHDYIAWAREVPGVTRVWVSRFEMGLGTVTVRFVRDDESIIPDDSAIEAVVAHIESKRPATAQIYVVAPVPFPVTLRIEAMPDTPTVREAIERELRDLFRREAQPGGRILLTHISEAISIAYGENDHVLLEPTQNVITSVGMMPMFGGIEWV